MSVFLPALDSAIIKSKTEPKPIRGHSRKIPRNFKSRKEKVTVDNSC